MCHAQDFVLEFRKPTFFENTRLRLHQLQQFNQLSNYLKFAISFLRIVEFYLRPYSKPLANALNLQHTVGTTAIPGESPSALKNNTQQLVVA